MNPIMVVAGTRPELIKLAPVIEWLEKLKADYLFVWSGQHYDYELSTVFFEQLRMPKADHDLHVGSGSHSKQTAETMLGLEKLIKKHSPSVVVAEGDTNTVVAASLVASKRLVPFAHVEAGLRSWNMTMPEEINRKVADAIATMHFAPTRLAMTNLLLEGVSEDSVYLTGNTIVDVVQKYVTHAKESVKNLLSKLKINADDFFLVTVHRAENTDNPHRLRNIAVALEELSRQYDIVFPIHPRTKRYVAKLGLARHFRSVKSTQPLGYLEFLGLLAYCRTVLTDSGGVQEEAFTLKVPAVTMRYNTERPETTMYGLNKLAGVDAESIVALALEQADHAKEAKARKIDNVLGDGHAGKRIAELLNQAAEEGIKINEPDNRHAPMVTYALLDSDKTLDSNHHPIIGFTKTGEPDLSMKNAKMLLARIAKKSDDISSADT